MNGFKIHRWSVYLGCWLLAVACLGDEPETGHQWLMIDLAKPATGAGRVTWTGLASGADGLCATGQAGNVAVMIQTTAIAVGETQKPVRTLSVRATISPHDKSAPVATDPQPKALGKMCVRYSSNQVGWSSWEDLRFTGHGVSVSSWTRQGVSIQETIERHETSLRVPRTDDDLSSIGYVELRYEAAVPVATCFKRFTLSLDSVDIPVNPRAYPRVVHLTNDLHIAVEKGNLDKVTSMLGAHPEQLELKDGNGWTPLIRAALKGDVAMVKMLLAKGADIEAADEPNRQTALHISASNDRLEVVQLLLAHGAKVNAKDRSGQTPLYLTANGGHNEVVKLLLANHADPNIAGRAGTTALHLAIHRGNKAVVEALVTNGADVQAPLDIHMWAMMYEREHMKEMLERFRPNLQSLVTTNRPVDKEQILAAVQASRLITPLALAEYYGEKEIAEVLRKHGAK